MTFRDMVTSTNPVFLEVFGDQATVSGGTLTVIFDAPYKGVPLYDTVVESSQPTATASDADIARLSVDRGDTITILGRTYTVTSMEPDGMGMTRMILEEQ